MKEYFAFLAVYEQKCIENFAHKMNTKQLFPMRPATSSLTCSNLASFGESLWPCFPLRFYLHTTYNILSAALVKVILPI